jgi:hypothetical protein
MNGSKAKSCFGGEFKNSLGILEPKKMEFSSV